MSEPAQLSLIEAEPVRPATGTALTPLDMLNTALARGADIGVMEKLMLLHERWEANQARKAFDAAIADAKGEIGPIVKTEKVDFTTSKGRTNYRYEDFAQVARTVDPVLHKHGLTYRHRASQEGNRLKVTCIISHRDGHSEETSLESIEDHSGNKNPIQAIGSAATYLQRYTLKLALGLSASVDDDGHATTRQALQASVDMLDAEPQPARQSSNSLKKNHADLWPTLEKAVRAATTQAELDRIWGEWNIPTSTWPKAWQEQVDELFVVRCGEVAGRDNEPDFPGDA